VVTLKKERLFATPQRPGAFRAGGRTQLNTAPPAQVTSDQPVSADLSSYFTQVLGLRKSDMVLRPLRKGATVIAGTILGRIGATAPGVSPHLLFEIRPGGPRTPLIDAKPILDGWKLLEATAIYRAAGQNPFLGPKARIPSVGQVFLMSKEALQQLVLRDPNVTIYSCGRRDVAEGRVDRRVLADLEFLSVSGFKPTVAELVCGPGAGGGQAGAGAQGAAGTTGPQGAGPPPNVVSPATVTEHASGNAMTIVKINDIPISGHQTQGSIADVAIRRMLTLQGFYKPYEIISKQSYPGTDNTLSLPDHADRIEVAFQPLFSTDPQLAKQVNSTLKPEQWIKLIDRLRQIPNPAVPLKPTSASIPSNANGG
jgi:hypothetical protein